MKRCRVYIGKNKIIDEKRPQELLPQELREIRNRYETHNTWIALKDIVRYPNDMDLVEYRFERRMK